MIIQLVPQFNCSPNFWQFWHISTFKGAIPWSQKELQHLPPAGRAVEGEGEGGHANEGGKQGGDAPQGPGAGCRAKGTFSQVQPERLFEKLDFPGSAGGWSAPFQNLKKRWNFFHQLDVKRLEFVSKHKDTACDTFFCTFSLMHWDV